MAANDVCLLAVESENQAIALSVGFENGFVEVPTWSPQSAGTAAINPGSRLALFWKRTLGGDTAPRVADPGDHATAQIHCFSGVITSGNPWDTGAGGNDLGVNDTAGTIPGSATTVVDTLVVLITSTSFNGTSTTQCSAWTNASLTLLTERTDNTNTQGLGGGHCLATGEKAGTGTYVNTTVTLANTSYKGAISLALKPQPPSVVSIALASPNPSYAGDVVSWTVTFSGNVTGVDATDFTLVPGGGVTGASITSVTGSGTTWTVTANSGTSAGTLGLNLVDDDSIASTGGTLLGGIGAGNGDFTGQVYTISPPFCTPPSNIPAGVSVSCVCDTFGRASLNPSTIYGANWIVSTSDGTGIVPSIVNPGYLRLTDRTANNAKAATVPGIFPAAGNYISVEFLHYAYNSATSGNIGTCASNTGADGIAVTLSDYSVTAVPGAFGGSLGYAQHTNPSNVVGFAGGWVGIALDEWGNFQNPTEGRIGGPGPTCESVGVRGSGSGMAGYPWIGGSGTLAPRIDNYTSAAASPGYYYQVIVDARNAGNATPQTFVSVARDTTGTGTTYSTVVPSFDVFAANPSQAVVPSNWQISFTGSTGGSNNIHEIGGLRVCAQTVAPPSGGTASGFNAIDEAYGTPPSGPAVQNFLTGHIYMKVTGLPFKLNVAALNNNQILTTYAAGGNKNVTVKLVDNSDSVCVLDSTQLNYCSAACAAKVAVTGGSQTLVFAAADSGKKQSANFTLNTAYKNLAAIISDGTTTACSTDAFSVRPTSIASVTSANATNTAVTGTPIFKAGTDVFSLTATTTGIVGSPSGYTGTLKINSAAIQAVALATAVGAVTPASFPAATSATPSSTTTGNTFTYSEVGAFYFRGYNPATDATSARGVYDGVSTATECAAPVTAVQCDTLRAATWMGVDSITSKGDCVQSNYSNTKDASGKYGCSFGIISDTAGFGRFTPDHFDITKIDGCTGGATFTYSGQPFALITVTARNQAGLTTANYHGAYNLAKNTTISDAGTTANFTPNNNTVSNNVLAATNFINGVASQSTVTYTFPAKETVPTTINLRATDTDLVTSSNSPAEIRSGRIHIYNSYGSELMDLPMSMQVEYYVDTTITAPATSPSITGWIANTNDTCSSVGLSALANFQGNLNAGETCVQDTGSPGVSGRGCAVGGPLAPVNERYLALPSATASYNLYLKAPGVGNEGGVDVSADLSAKTWLRFDWNGTGLVDPTARATFGLYRGNPRSIYLRERY
ncbi:MAG: hypothetical protein HY081_02135 [Gammaproteobacteria bacterium]|nr:hypothetical protein [Gammaproteobacteria bacterium]